MRIARQIAPAVTLLASSAGAFAHQGHGMPGPAHWHVTDAVGLALVTALAALAIWLARGR